jgi:hypothetical protein
VDYIDRKKDPLMQVVKTHQHNSDSAVQTARRLKIEVQSERREIKKSISEKKEKDGKRRACTNLFHVTLKKSWWILNSHIAG